jgi:hypothetical protein
LRGNVDRRLVTIKLQFILFRNFVHDPKMANEPTVSATVKLQYIGRNGDRYVVTRCMEAKQMAKTVTGTFQYNLIYTSRIVNIKKVGTLYTSVLRWFS